MGRIVFESRSFGIDDFSKREIFIEGWYIEGKGLQCFDSYLSALAWQSDCWEEYCEYYRTKE